MIDKSTIIDLGTVLAREGELYTVVGDASNETGVAYHIVPQSDPNRRQVIARQVLEFPEFTWSVLPVGATTWINLGIPFGNVYAANADEELDSAKKRGIIKPGVMIEFMREDKITPVHVLIGHINELGGLCDDCLLLNGDTIITRYRVLIPGLKSI